MYIYKCRYVVCIYIYMCVCVCICYIYHRSNLRNFKYFKELVTLRPVFA